MRMLPLPDFWFDAEGRKRRILERVVPYYMPGTLDCTAATKANVFSVSSFTHADVMPFEVTRYVPRVTTYSSGTTIQADPQGARVVGDELFRWVSLTIKGIGKVRDFTKAAQLLSTLIPHGDGSVELDAPVYLEAGHGFSVTVDNDLTSGYASGIRMELSFHGSLFRSSRPGED